MQSTAQLVRSHRESSIPATLPPMIEPILLTSARLLTYDGDRLLTNASSFFFARDERLFLVTSRHVMIDGPSNHYPNRIEIELHVDPDNLEKSARFGIPLYKNNNRAWRQPNGGAGNTDVAVIEVERTAMPANALYRAFTPEHLRVPDNCAQVGTNVLVVAFPLGFHDTLHHMPVVRHAVIASSFGLRFQGEGYFLTDARTHRGTSGAPVVMRVSGQPSINRELPWVLLGIHSARIDMSPRDITQDEALGLNSAWYADVLMSLTAH